MLAGVVTFAALAAFDAGTAEVKADMRANFAALVALQPVLVSPTAFRDPKNQPMIAASVAILARVQRRPPRPDEPLTNAVAHIFADAVRRAQGDLSGGHLEDARLRLRGLTGL